MYEQGLGTARNPRLALINAALVADQLKARHQKEAASLRDRLAASMTSTEVEEALKLALEKYPPPAPAAGKAPRIGVNAGAAPTLKKEPVKVKYLGE